MTDRRTLSFSLRPGWTVALGALAAASSAIGAIVAVSPVATEIGGRLAITALGLFAVALAAGSARFVGLSSLVALGAVLAAGSPADPAWGRSIAIGCLWYVGVELAWHSIDRREWSDGASSVVRRRIGESATVVVLAVAIVVLSIVVSGAAPERSALAQGPVVVGVLVALIAATRTQRAARTTASEADALR